MGGAVPRFEPHPLLPNGHWQTVVGRYLGRAGRLEARPVVLDLPDGDRVRLEDSGPDGWKPGDPAAVLVHGLAGCARSPYVVRLARRLVAGGVRVARMNLRGAGRGFGLARGIYHAGRTGDVRAAVEWVAGQAPGSPVALVGFSLGGSLALRLAAEAADEPVDGLDCVVAANAPLDLSACCRNMRTPGRRVYDRNFVRSLRKEIARLHARFPDLGPTGLEGVETVYDFDDRYTAPRNGYRDAEDYYARTSAGPLLGRITIPGLILHAEDDPFIPAETYRGLALPPGLALELIPCGGHLGYISRGRWGGDRRWLDSRLALWLAERWGAARIHPEGAQRP